MVSIMRRISALLNLNCLGLDWAPAQPSLFLITVVLTMWKPKKGVTEGTDCQTNVSEIYSEASGQHHHVVQCGKW